MATEDIIVRNMWDAGDSLITQLELNKGKRIRIFDNDTNSEYTDADGDTWCYPIIALLPYNKKTPTYSRLEGMHNFFFIDVIETHTIERTAGMIPDNGLDSIYKQYTAESKRMLYGLNNSGIVEHILSFCKKDNLRVEADKPKWL